MPRRPDLPPLERESLAADPVEQFTAWWEWALAEVPLPEATTLATADGAGAPDARMVLLKGFDERGFRFHTNHRSAKAGQLEENPRAALVVYWRELDRQVRIRGRVERLDDAESDAYFETRAPASQVGAWASPQSAPVASRAELEQRVREVEERFGSEPIPRPEHWGGYRVRHEEVEFWQGQVARLHDRFLYTRAATGAWAIARLAP